MVDQKMESLAELEFKLRDLSHDDQALKIIRDFATSLKKTSHRQAMFNAKGALVRDAIAYADALAKAAIDPSDDPFVLLQGDLVSTDAAYLIGERLVGMKFAIASSTCDLVAERREYAALLRIQPITATTPGWKQILGELLKFQSSWRMYLPPLSVDASDVLFNVIVFDGIVQIRLGDLHLATRHGSLSLVGWRVFGSLVRNIMVRAADGEAKLRATPEDI